MDGSLTLHYFGRLRSLDALRELQEEFEEIARVSGWNYELVNETFTVEAAGHVAARPEKSPEPLRKLILRGIRLSVEGAASPLQATFDADGYLSHVYADATSVGRPVVHQVHAKTRIPRRDARTHRTLVRLLDYLKKRYVPNLEVIDPTGYWVSRDENVLKAAPVALLR